MFSDGTILGTSQWTWLERELKGPESAVTIIGSSIQVSQAYFFNKLLAYAPFSVDLYLLLFGDKSYDKISPLPCVV